MNTEIKRLANKTTIIQVINNTTKRVEYGNENITSRYSDHHLKQIDISTLVEHWQNKWDSFGGDWNIERQNYRNLLDTFKMFYHSFYLLKKYKHASIPLDPYDKKFNLYIELSGVNLFGMYNHGKKCVDLIEKLEIVKLLDKNENDYINKFKETRNKLFEHNFNPYGLNITIDPSTWSIASTNSFCDISIHGQNEREYDVKIDYYDDYYRLENILVKIIKGF